VIPYFQNLAEPAWRWCVVSGFLITWVLLILSVFAKGRD
jgi:hypothetical protein